MADLNTAAEKNATLPQKVLETGAKFTQNFDPIKNVCHSVLTLSHIHFTMLFSTAMGSTDMTRQVVAHHFCSSSSHRGRVRQCVIYDGPGPDAKLVGIEYIIDKEVFEKLPAEEKKLWHSHFYEITSGTLALPTPSTIPSAVALPFEDRAMEDLIHTYGKIWYTWQVDRGDPIPLGVPQLMMAFTRDGQLQEEILRARDESMGIDSQERKERRQKLVVMGKPDIGGDEWEKTGRGVKLECVEEDIAGYGPI
ncbi:uncharacterized protein VTP21DRAFT_8084 [Calcarisporiella thermophila]|uniref:uncharacterized protein n=1 Tax=Calcarisporiella thermophila TaxID=911321 RepID=UPI00374419F0